MERETEEWTSAYTLNASFALVYMFLKGLLHGLKESHFLISGICIHTYIHTPFLLLVCLPLPLQSKGSFKDISKFGGEMLRL